MRRIPEGSRWDAELIRSVKALPWDLNGEREEVGEEIEGPERVQSVKRLST